MISTFPRAALTALSCLAAACGDGIYVPAPAEHAPAPLAAEAPALDEPAPSPTPDPDEPTITLDAPLEAWPIAFETKELAAIDAAAFLGDALYVAGRAADRLTLTRFVRRDGAVVPFARFALVRPGASRVALAASSGMLVATWVADGHLEGVRVSAASDLARLDVQRLSGEEGGQLAGDPVIALAADGALICASDKLGPTCFAFDQALALDGVHVLKKQRGTPQALMPLGDGLALVLGVEKGNRLDLAAVALEPTGAPSKTRSPPLPEVQRERDVAFVPDGDGFVLVARRPLAGEHSAWRVAPGAANELDGRFSRVVGGFAHAGRTLLIERAHLQMRKGFPVRGFALRPLEIEHVRGGKATLAKVEREAFPDAVADLLPTDPEQTLLAGDGALVFEPAPRKGQLRATALRLLSP